MGRLQRAYEAKYRSLLRRIGARRAAQGLVWFQARTEQIRRDQGLAEARALDRVWRQARQRTQRRNVRQGDASSSEASVPPPQSPPRFLCDAGLGALARWLRAAGYAARWIPDISDAELLREAQDQGESIVTTDSLLMERRILRDALFPAVWVSPSLKPVEQLAAVLDELQLPLGEPRCMNCGGGLVWVDKESVRERIPPRTYRWLNEYFLCEACGQLFWRGTHWQRIQKQLRERARPPR